MSERNDGGPAYPLAEITTDLCNGIRTIGNGQRGMSLRQRAAIDLRVPQSGTPWLDAMITEARRMDYAGLDMQGFAASGKDVGHGVYEETAAESAFKIADAMLTASTPQAASEWPAMPSDIPPLPEPNCVYIGKGVAHDGPLRFMYYDKEIGYWMRASRAYGCMAFHYAVHRDDLPKVRRVQP